MPLGPENRKACPIRFIRMEFGIPGLPANRAAIDAERYLGGEPPDLNREI